MLLQEVRVDSRRFHHLGYIMFSALVTVEPPTEFGRVHVGVLVDATVVNRPRFITVRGRSSSKSQSIAHRVMFANELQALAERFFAAIVDFRLVELFLLTAAFKVK